MHSIVSSVLLLPDGSYMEWLNLCKPYFKFKFPINIGAVIMNKKISVIVPVYNTSKYLKKCLDSLVNQTYSNMEIIVVDDGSTDNSGEICDSYATEYPSKIIVVHTENHGLSSARNTGLNYAQGDYIGFVDSDDWVANDMFEILLNNLLKTQSDLSVCGLKYAYDVDECTGKRENISVVYKQDEIFEQIMKNKSFYGYACNKLFKKELIENLVFDEKLLSCEDLVFSVKYAAKCIRAVSTNDELYYYRQHTGSMTGEFKYNIRKLSVLDAYEMIMPIYEEKKSDLLYVLERNYLKINLNIKGRMRLSHIEDNTVKNRLNHNIGKFLSIVLREKQNSLTLKANVIMCRCFPGMMLWIKQMVLKSRYRGN